jgi:hypothetical protein
MLGQHWPQAGSLARFSPERIEAEMALFAAKMAETHLLMQTLKSV